MKTFIILAFVVCFSYGQAASALATSIPTKMIGCVENGITYMPGQHLDRNACNHCTCGDSGRFYCYVVDCAMPPCVDAVTSPDRCCPVCPNGANCRAPDGTIIQSGQKVTLKSGAICSCPTNAGFGFGWGEMKASCVIADHAFIVDPPRKG